MTSSDKVAACLWHAYYSLSEQSRKEFVQIGQLKVLTQSLAALFHLNDFDKKLEGSFDADATITFPSYLNFMKKELIDPVTSADSNSSFDNITSRLNQFDEVCWLICSKTYLKNSHGILGNTDTYRLWRLFNHLAETDEADNVICPVVVDREEAELICQKIVPEHKKFDFDSIVHGFDQLGFTQFLHVIEGHCLVETKDSIASSIIAELFDDQVAQVLKKGYLSYKGHKLTGGWKELWCVLTVSQLSLYSSREETDLKEKLLITTSCKLENLTEKSGVTVLNIGIGAKSNRFALNDGTKQNIELSANDSRTKTEWLNAIDLALGWSSRGSSPKLTMLKVRKQKRLEKRERLKKESELKQQKEDEFAKTRMELDAEKRARQDAEERVRQEEARYQEEQLQKKNTQRQLEEEIKTRELMEQLLEEETQLRKLEQQRLAELEQMRAQLESVLRAEQKAKQEEEIVKAMQAKILEEEFERREQLERMQMELRKLLQDEQLKNISLEEMRMKQEEIIRKEEEKLKALMNEKETQQHEYQTAVMKLQEAENMKAKMEQELKLKEQEREKLTEKIRKSRLFLNMPTHRGIGAFVDQDYTKRTNLTPLSPDSPSYNLVKVCRSPISPPLQPELVRGGDKTDRYVPPVPIKRKNRRILGSQGSEDQPKEDLIEPTSPQLKFISETKP